MANIKLTAQERQLVNALDNSTAAFGRLHNAMASVATIGKTITFTAEGEAIETVSKSFEIATAKGKKFVLQTREVDGVLASSTLRIRQQSQAFKDHAAAAERSAAAQKKSVGVAQQFVTQLRRGTTPDTGGISLRDVSSYQSALSGLQLKIVKHNATTQELNKIWRDISNNTVRNYGGRLASIQTAMLRVAATGQGIRDREAKATQTVSTQAKTKQFQETEQAWRQHQTRMNRIDQVAAQVRQSHPQREDQILRERMKVETDQQQMSKKSVSDTEKAWRQQSREQRVALRERLKIEQEVAQSEGQLRTEAAKELAALRTAKSTGIATGFTGGIRQQVLGGISPVAVSQLGVPIRGFENAVQSANAMLVKHNVSLSDMERIWTSISQGVIQDYGNQGLNNAHRMLLGVHNASVKVAEAQLKIANATAIQNRRLQEQKDQVKGLLISWQSIFRLFLIQAVHIGLANMIQSLRAGVSEALKLQKAVVEIQTISQDSAGHVESMAKWLSVAVGLSNQFGTKVADELESAYEALSNQVINTSQEFAIFGKTVDQFAAVTKTTATNASNLLTASLKGFDKSLEDTERSAAILFTTIKEGRVRGEEMANIYGQVTVIAHQLGVAEEELNALTIIGTIRGIKYEEMQTQIRNVLVKLLKPTKEMASFFRDLGVASGEAAVESFGLANIFALVTQRTGGASEEIVKYWNNIRGMTLALLATGKQHDEYRKALEQVRGSLAEYNRAIEITMNSSAMIIQQNLSRIRNYFQMTFGQGVINAAASVKEFSSIVIGATEVLKTLLYPASVLIIAQVTKLAWSIRILGAATGPVVLALTAIGLAITLIQRAERSRKEAIEATYQVALAALTKEQKLRQNLTQTTIKDEADRIKQLIQDKNTQLAIVTGLYTQEGEAYATLTEDIKTTTKDMVNGVQKDVKAWLKDIDSGISDLDAKIKKIRQDRLERPFKTEMKLFDWQIEGQTAVQQFGLIEQKKRDFLKRMTIAERSGNKEVFDELADNYEQLLERQQGILQSAPKTGRGRIDPRTMASVSGQFEAFSQTRQQADLRMQQSFENQSLRLLSIKLQLEAAEGRILETEKQVTEEFTNQEKKGFATAKTAELKRQITETTLQRQTITDPDAREANLQQQADLQKQLITQSAADRTNAFNTQITQMQELADARIQLANSRAATEWRELAATKSTGRDRVNAEIAIEDRRVQAVEEAEKTISQAKDLAKKREIEAQKDQFRLEQETNRNLIAETQATREKISAESERLTETRVGAKGSAAAIGKLLGPTIIEMDQLDPHEKLRQQRSFRKSPLGQGLFPTLNASSGDAFINLFRDAGTFQRLAALTTSGQASPSQLAQAIVQAESFSGALGKGMDKMLAKGEPVDKQQEIKTALDTFVTETKKLSMEGGFTEVEKALAQNQLMGEKLLGELNATASKLTEPMDKLNITIATGLTPEIRNLASVIKAKYTPIAEGKTGIPAVVAPDQDHAFGGVIGGLGRAFDTVPIRASRGEFITNARSSGRFRAQLLTMNQGLTPSFPFANAGSTYSFGDMHINLHGFQNPSQTGSEIIKDLRRRIRRGEIAKV